MAKQSPSNYIKLFGKHLKSVTPITTQNHNITTITELYFKAAYRKHCRMAKPIPDLNIQILSLKEEKKPKEESIIDSAINKITKKKTSRDLVLGTLSGWMFGIGSYRVGKVAAFGLGGGVIILHFATELGYIQINWDRIKEGLSHSEQLVDKVVRFAKENSCFSVGFVGGFFFGVASA